MKYLINKNFIRAILLVMCAFYFFVFHFIFFLRMLKALGECPFRGIFTFFRGSNGSPKNKKFMLNLCDLELLLCIPDTRDEYSKLRCTDNMKTFPTTTFCPASKLNSPQLYFQHLYVFIPFVLHINTCHIIIPKKNKNF